ncbi:hypothetical protein BO70DRAFT_365213 [Aspergillus heteromorphus CBS 117.55]|uniref:Uncharacterized protein n=1 Tax=Aspergillus heteromorphus CBS 117.55 TaxID=1448321 RepID=A0A317VAV6_9EURO|nr:uncharacterized protein BO70DRAFT_365213 [Aspergillus heteromorphus CBS 117.55]PWY71483.1 hypothetical protein BO70DRAFT_365213 [Aspergillus heteromorphus CBS 117.55]
MTLSGKDYRTSRGGDESCDTELHSQDTTKNLKDHDWNQLEEEYIDSMEKHGGAEQALCIRVSKLLEIFTAWSETTITRDEIRALKRFKTQVQHVQTSEENLEKKRKHYIDVVKAFESALALLNDRVKP